MNPDPKSDVNYTGPATPSSQPIQTTDDVSAPTSGTGAVEWNASEFIDHHKNFGWFVLLTLAGIGACALAWFLTKGILTPIVIGIAALSFGVLANKKPRTLSYKLTPSMLQIGEKTYSYEDFRLFSVIQDGALFSILLEPVRRFMPPLTIYFDPQDGEAIFDILAQRIPHEERTADPIDRMMRRLRF